MRMKSDNMGRMLAVEWGCTAVAKGMTERILLMSASQKATAL